MTELRFPTDSERTLILGSTGTGKTRLAFFVLAHMSYTEKPWVIVNSKGEELFDRIPFAQQWTFLQGVPTEPGIYIVSPGPNDTDEYDDFLRKVWERGNVGLFIDEGWMVPSRAQGYAKPWYEAIMTQGRSKMIPVITCSQRPAWLSRFAFSESSIFFVMPLTDKDDYKRVRNFVPYGDYEKLPRFHSYYYNVAERKGSVLRPVPPEKKTLDVIRYRLEPEPELVQRVRWI